MIKIVKLKSMSDSDSFVSDPSVNGGRTIKRHSKKAYKKGRNLARTA